MFGVGTAAAGFFEEIIHSLDQDFVLAIAEFAVEVEFFEFGGGGFGGGFTMFLQVQDLAGEASEDTD